MRPGRSAGRVTVLADGTTVRLRPLGRGERDLVAGLSAGSPSRSSLPSAFPHAAPAPPRC
jgi:hypothetical protein